MHIPICVKDYPAGQTDWFHAGPFGDSMDDIAAFNKIAIQLSESCDSHSYTLLEVTEIGTPMGYILVHPRDAEAMRVIGRMVKAHNDDDLLEKYDLDLAAEMLAERYWADLGLSDRIDFLQKTGANLCLATRDDLPLALADPINSIIELEHPFYGC